ncbi:MAG: hypothetical protein K2H09_02010 [Treponemataceae bacterium]|nr:hypothetical protein [Treponemataceae bacterium]
MKTSRLILAAASAAIFLAACSEPADGDIPPAPVVNLPASVGDNPFKGKTFFEGSRTKYVFSSDGTTITWYYDDEDDGLLPEWQYTCSVDADAGELSWTSEKIGIKGRLYSFAEYAAYCSDGSALRDYEAELREDLAAGSITQERFDEKLAEAKEEIDALRADGFESLKLEFSFMQTFSYTYDKAEGTLDLNQLFDEDSARFRYRSYGSSSNESLELSQASVNMLGWATVTLEGNNSYKYFYVKSFKSFSKSDKKIVFVNEDDESDTFTAEYTLSGSGNGTKLDLSFTYGGEPFSARLDFEPDVWHWTEAAE